LPDFNKNIVLKVDNTIGDGAAIDNAAYTVCMYLHTHASISAGTHIYIHMYMYRYVGKRMCDAPFAYL